MIDDVGIQLGGVVMMMMKIFARGEGRSAVGVFTRRDVGFSFHGAEIDDDVDFLVDVVVIVVVVSDRLLFHGRN